MTKSELAALIKLGRVHECFTHSTEGEFDVTLMRLAAPVMYEPFTSDLTPEIVECIKKTRDWERSRILEITREQMDEPSLWVLLPCNEHLLIDGTHRLLARATAGLTKFDGYMARYDQVIRVDQNLMYTNPNHDWGRIEIRGGKLYDRETGKQF
jgi:hypothetical protein